VRQLKRLEHELKKFEVELAANSRHGLIADLKEQSLVLDINNTSPQGLSLAAQRRKHKRHTPEPVPEYREAVSMPVMQHMPDPQPSPRGRPSTYKKKEKVVERVVEEIPQAMQAIPQHTDHLLHLQKIKEADPNEPRYCVCNQVGACAPPRARRLCACTVLGCARCGLGAGCRARHARVMRWRAASCVHGPRTW